MKINIDKTHLIFGIPLIGYLMAYIFELGYLKTYGIDHQFIKIDTLQLIQAVALSIIAFGLADFLFTNFPKEQKQGSHRQRFVSQIKQLLYLSFAALLLCSILYFAFNKTVLLLIPGFFLFAVLIIFLMLTFYVVKHRNLEKALEAYVVRVDRQNEKYPPKRISNDRVYLAFIIMTMGLFSYWGGSLISRPAEKNESESGLISKSVKNKNIKFKTYSVKTISDEEYKVLIRKYGDVLILKTYSKTSKTFKDGYETEGALNQKFKQVELIVDL